MRTVCSFSGGKDSTAMLIRLCKEGARLDDIVYVDCGSWEFPQMRSHVDTVEKLIQRSITRLLLNPDLDYYMFDYIPSNPKNKTRVWERYHVRGLGWPTPKIRWCNNIKRKAITRAVSVSVQYVGISADEPHRAGRCRQRGSTKIYPLIDWGMSTSDCLAYCKSFGLDWSGLYNHFSNTSCWCCPLKPLHALRNLRKHYPNLWSRLLDMDSRSWNTFKPRNITACLLDYRFSLEQLGSFPVKPYRPRLYKKLPRN